MSTSSPNYSLKYNHNTVLLPTSLNTSAIILRWIERPKRDSTQFHNWSTLALAHIEFAGLISMVSMLLSNVLLLFVDKLLANKWIKNHGGRFDIETAFIYPTCIH